jgi:hypothetical protein
MLLHINFNCDIWIAGIDYSENRYNILDDKIISNN